MSDGKYLITTEDESTWKFDRSVIFLGEWCRLFSRKHIWENLDAIVAEPYGLNSSQKEIDYLKVIKLEEKLLPELAEILNRHFNCKKSLRYWNIIVGPWLRTILQLLLNRTHTLIQCFENYKISGTTLYSYYNQSLAALDMKSSYNLFDNEKWNNVLNGKIMQLIIDKNISIEVLKDKNFKYQLNSFSLNKDNISQNYKKRLKRFFYNFYSKLASKLSKNNDGFIIGTYLPVNLLIKLEIALKQWPQIRIKNDTDLNSINEVPNIKLRKNLTTQLTNKSLDNFENVTRSLLFELFPVCYLEGFEKMNLILSKKLWPKSPKFIFTSNNYNSDEIFKLYTATQVENGKKYFIGQHGNRFFTDKYFSYPVEEKICDNFLTWGWSKKSKKYLPTFILNTAGRSKIYNTRGKLLLIQKKRQRRFYTWDSPKEYDYFLKNQITFLNKLSERPNQKILIRLGNTIPNKKFRDEFKLINFKTSLKFDPGIKPIKKLVQASRLVVHSYDSTGLLETLSQNIPTIAFWENELDHLREEVKDDYQRLIDVGIIHLSPLSAAEKINEIWDNIGVWWFQKSVQDAKDKFCNVYAKSVSNPVNTLVNKLI